MQQSINSDRLCLWEPATFDPTQIRPPLTDHLKIVTGDYVGDSYLETKFGANPPMGASGQMSEI